MGRNMKSGQYLDRSSNPDLIRVEFLPELTSGYDKSQDNLEKNQGENGENLDNISTIDIVILTLSIIIVIAVITLLAFFLQYRKNKGKGKFYKKYEDEDETDDDWTVSVDQNEQEMMTWEMDPVMPSSSFDTVELAHEKNLK